MTTKEDTEIGILVEHTSRLMNKLLNIAIWIWVMAGIAKLLFIAAILMFLYYLVQLKVGGVI